MPSSPADPEQSQPLPLGPQPADAVLRALARAYDEALAAAAADDLDAVAQLLAAADELLGAPLLPTPATATAELAALRADAQAAHARLHAVVEELCTSTATELARTRKGRKALAGYAGLRTLGDKFESRI